MYVSGLTKPNSYSHCILFIYIVGVDLEKYLRSKPDPKSCAHHLLRHSNHLCRIKFLNITKMSILLLLKLRHEMYIIEVIYDILNAILFEIAILKWLLVQKI